MGIESGLAVGFEMRRVHVAADGIGSHVVEGQVLGLLIVTGDIQNPAIRAVGTGQVHL